MTFSQVNGNPDKNCYKQTAPEKEKNRQTA